MKTVFAPHLNKHVRVGGYRVPRVPRTHLTLRHIMHEVLITKPPPLLDLTAASLDAQRDVDLNDNEGDCVCAGRAHRIALITGAAGKLFRYTHSQVQTEYSRIGGYVPGDPATDQGCDMTVAAEDGVKNGYADGSKDVGFVAVNAADKNEVMASFFVLENGDLGIALPDAWINPFPSGDDFVWDVAGPPNPENGHCVQVVGYDATRGVRINSWGLFGWITWAALAKYAVPAAGGTYLVHANADQISKATQKSPEGFDWNTVIAFFDSTLGGTAPLPPAPGPTPAPGSVTLVQAQSWVDAGIHAGPAIQTRASASRRAQEALAANWPKP